MAINFGAATITRDGVTGLYKCEFKAVTGNTADPSATVAEGKGDTEYQARRAAVVTYRKANPLAFLDIPTT